MLRRVLLGAIAATLLAAGLAGCSASGGQTAFRVALGRVDDTPNARGEVYFDDTAALIRLVGRGYSSKNRFADLRGLGSASLVGYERILADDLHLSLFDADYMLQTGTPPKGVGVVAGGQSGAVADRLIAWGWHRKGDRLVAPGLADAKGDSAVAPSLALRMAQVRITGSDVVYGDANADLDTVGAASVRGLVDNDRIRTGRRTLADDPRTGALADCLGDVVAAGITAYHGNRTPTSVAVGITRPAGKNDTPHAVVCVAWPSAAAANRYAKAVRKALTSGSSIVTQQRYAELLRDPSVGTPGGAQHIVSWQANVPQRAILVFQMLERRDLPALPDCSRLPPSVREHAGAECD